MKMKTIWMKIMKIMRKILNLVKERQKPRKTEKQTVHQSVDIKNICNIYFFISALLIIAKKIYK